MLTDRSLKALTGVHPDLVRVVHRAAEIGPSFVVTEGVRSIERQRALRKAGKSRTLDSRHLTGHAVDFVSASDGGISYELADMRPVADAFAQAAGELGVKITRGIDWGWDSPHIELERKAYPADKPNSVTEQPNSATASPNLVTPQPVAPAAPMRKSGTVWGTITGALAAAVAYMETAAASLIEWAAKLSELGPVTAALAGMGGNIKSMTLGLGIGAAVFVISRRWRAYIEGKPG
jgi:peptidoglycan L-alanyl-D-glutamate endopeptidase CwlK